MDRVVTDEDFKILRKLEEYKHGRACPNPDSYETMIEQVHNLIEKLYDLADYKMKMEMKTRRRRLSNVVVMDRDGDIWKSDDVPVGMETEAIIRLLNSSEARDRRDFYALPVHIRSTELRIPKDVTFEQIAGTSMSFRKVEKLQYRR